LDNRTAGRRHCPGRTFIVKEHQSLCIAEIARQGIGIRPIDNQIGIGYIVKNIIAAFDANARSQV